MQQVPILEEKEKPKQNRHQYKLMRAIPENKESAPSQKTKTENTKFRLQIFPKFN